MSARARILQADVTRAVRGARDGGVDIGSIRIMPDGEIVIVSKACAESFRLSATANPLDEVLLHAAQGKTAR
ncbi:MAG: hypothetical protein ACK4UL_09965 [Novosphingobium meiothermophilum]|uniref:hypothetical protein n=1 Tax=Novosphingobium TaxID=165696 RepID=UPI000D6E79FF|nr:MULTISPECIES: hypothetical protein [Novosphingobium]